ncbi:MAG: hypothetical protein Q4D92_08230, partial [Slackia sp.]|nr:hypothetical protein [Slackia sp.]
MLGGFDFERSDQRPFRAAACVGYALLLYVCQMTLWGGLLLASRISFDVLDLIKTWSVPLCAALALVCIGAAIVSRRLSPLSWCDVLFAVVSCVAIASGYLVAVWTGGVVVLVCLGAALLGAGLALAFLAWCAPFSRMGLGHATDTVLCAVVLGSALSLVSSLLSMEGLEVSFFIAVALSSVLLFFCRTRGGTGAECAHESRAGACPSSTSSLLKESFESVRMPLLCACAIAFAVAITRMMSLTMAPDMSVGIGVLGVLFAGCAALLLLVVLRKRGSHVSIPSLFQILFPVVATLLLVMSAAGPVIAVLVGAAVFSIHSIMFALVMPACIEGAAKTDASTSSVYGLFAGAVYALFALATWIGASLFAGAGFGPSVSLVAVLLVFYVLAMAYAFAQRRLSHAADARDGANGQAGGVFAAGAPSPDESCGAGQAAGESACMNMVGGEADAPSCDEACAQSDAESDVESAAETRKDEDPIERRCLNVACAYGLSPRETDVLVAYAHGRNVAYLAEHLVLSSNTIRSHSKTL